MELEFKRKVVILERMIISVTWGGLISFGTRILNNSLLPPKPLHTPWY